MSDAAGNSINIYSYEVYYDGKEIYKCTGNNIQEVERTIRYFALNLIKADQENKEALEAIECMHEKRNFSKDLYIGKIKLYKVEDTRKIYTFSIKSDIAYGIRVIDEQFTVVQRRIAPKKVAINKKVKEKYYLVAKVHVVEGTRRATNIMEFSYERYFGCYILVDKNFNVYTASEEDVKKAIKEDKVYNCTLMHIGDKVAIKGIRGTKMSNIKRWVAVGVPGYGDLDNEVRKLAFDELDDITEKEEIVKIIKSLA